MESMASSASLNTITDPTVYSIPTSADPMSTPILRSSNILSVTKKDNSKTFLFILVMLAVVGIAIFVVARVTQNKKNADNPKLMNVPAFGPQNNQAARQNLSSGGGSFSPSQITGSQLASYLNGAAGGNNSAVVAFVMQGCGWCDKLKAELKGVDRTNIPIYLVDQASAGAQEFIQKLRIEGFPTIYKLSSQKAQKYEGSRTASSITAFASSV